MTAETKCELDPFRDEQKNSSQSNLLAAVHYKTFG